ncbi:unnamed protein product [Rhizoctonia solani]|uniref:Secreted protein n=1 Tax=Rhizoctonia solani TaxID=456999 RepID=A0A8H3HZJ0_9AGAM|nr:unnamed protein product [Rhizoctonia solani]
MLGLKVSAILAACAYMVVAVPTTDHHGGSMHVVRKLKCPPGDFWWPAKRICLVNRGRLASVINKTPRRSKCPKEWFYKSSEKYCVPRMKRYMKNPTCVRGYTLESDTFLCKPAAASTSTGRGRGRPPGRKKKHISKDDIDYDPSSSKPFVSLH